MNVGDEVMVGVLKSKFELVQSDIESGLRTNLRFYPLPNTEAFKRLPEKVQDEAKVYWEKEQDRVDRLLQEAEQGEW